MSLNALKLTVAQTRARLPLVDGIEQGTAFLITRTLVLTCAHCLGRKDNYAKEVGLHFSQWAPDQSACQADVLDDVAWDVDVALLKLREEAPVDAVPRSDCGANDAEWKSFGHPRQVDTDGVVFSGVVQDVNGQCYGRKAMQLSCGEARDSVGGASGSPIMVDGQIVGMLTNQLLQFSAQAGEGTRPAGSSVLKCEAWDFSVFCRSQSFC